MINPNLTDAKYAAAAVALALVALPAGASAQTSWQPFDPFSATQPSQAGAKPEITPPAGHTPAGETAMRDAPVQGYAIPPSVERGDLAPVMAGDGSGLPYELWRGLDLAGIEKLFAEVTIPSRSPALNDLWQRLVTAAMPVPAHQTHDMRFAALRLEGLYRSGLATDAAGELAKLDTAGSPLLAIYEARTALANANPTAACTPPLQSAVAADLPRALKTDALLIGGYCAALASDRAGAGLAAELAREEDVPSGPGLAALDAFSVGAKPRSEVPAPVGLVDYRLVEIAGGAAPALDDLVKAEPALLVSLTNDAKSPPAARLAAAEAAARSNAIPPDALAAIYTAMAGAESADNLLSGTAAPGAMRRAGLFKAAEAERTPMKKTRLIRAFVDEARSAGLSLQALRMSAPAANTIKAEPELVWFAETAAEIGLVAQDFAMTRRWVGAAAPAAGSENGLAHWLALADIADADNGSEGAHLKELESLALRARLAPNTLHRLATVLDALNYLVPIPLWEAASRTPQPEGGFLPETGVLSELQQAAKKKEFGHTVLLVMKTLGPDAAEGAHIIALGDSIRALKRAGLESDARQLAVEALIRDWPRSAVN